MNILLLAILFLFAPFCIFADQNQTKNGSIQPPPSVAQSSSPVKNGTAAGRYGGGGGGYSAQQYSAEYEVAYEHSQRLIDDYVCDLDASILVVTNSDRKYQKESAYGNGQQPEYGQKEEYGGGKSGYAAGRTEGKRGKRGAPNYGGRGYGERRREYGQMNDAYGGGDYGQKDYGHTNEYSVAKAHRLRCSAIAVNSDEDCKKCCHMAARKERSISKESIVGFIVDYDEIRQPSTGYEPSPYRMKRNADEPIYPPSAKPEDYQYNVGGGQQNYGKQGSGGYSQNGGTGEGNNGQEGGYGKKEESSYGNQPSNYGNTYSYNYPQRPKNARCVCCAPKANVPSSKGDYESGYGKGGGDGYGGGKHENYNEYGQEGNNNGYGGDEHESEESGEQGYGPMGPPPRQNYGMEKEYGRGNDRREGYGNDGGRRQYYGHGGGEYGGNGKKGRKYGRNKGGPY